MVAALIVVTMGTMSFAAARLVQQRMDVSTEMRLSNYAGTLALNAAESGVNRLLYAWNSGGTPAGVAPAPVAYAVTTPYSPTLSVVSNCAYSTTVSAGPPYTVTVTATVTTPTYPSQAWQSVARSVTVTINNTPGFWSVLRYAR